MIAAMRHHLAKHFPFLEGKKLLLAVSGGIDSVVLAHLLYTLDYTIALAHVNFQLRSQDSDDDEAFVKQLAHDWHLSCFTKRVDTSHYAKIHQVSTQMAARDIRYKWFDQLLNQQQYDYVLTAHHLDDSIETFIININRKTGLDGLTGIKAVNGNIIRPLLHLKREDIYQYALDHHLTWREDKTNATIKYERNHIRHKLMPVWETINPNFKSDLHQTMQFLDESKALIDDYLALVKPHFWSENNDISINLNALRALPNHEPILYHSLKAYGFRDWTAVKNLLTSQSGKQVLSDQYTLLKNRDTLLLYSTEKNVNTPQTIDNAFKINGKTYNISILTDKNLVDFSTPNTEYFDKNEIELPLHIRTWQTGDYFYPLGLNGKKKVSDFFTDQKISLRKKTNISLLCDASDQIIWIIGYRMDHRFRVTDHTQTILKVTFD